MTPSPTITLKNTFFIAAALLLAGGAYTVGSQARLDAADNTQFKLSVAEKALAAGDGRLALSLFTPLAKAGNAKADYWMADLYAHGLGTPKDEARAIGYLKQAAAKGLVPAEAKLGRLYAAGDQTVQDFSQAKIWLAKAALRGDAAAERRLGRLYEQGLGVARDPIAAYAWYENAVLRGDIPAERLRNQVLAQLAPGALSKAEAQAKTLNATIGGQTGQTA